MTSAAGHPAIKLQPEDWQAIKDAGMERPAKPASRSKVSGAPTVNATIKTGTPIDTINKLVAKKELNVPRRLRPRRPKGSRLLSEVASALVCCSTAAPAPSL
eukprot:8315953-Pyramimonas_sp.AAC.1